MSPSSSLPKPGPTSFMVIREVTPSITTLSVPFTLPGGVKAGGRGTIVRLSTGSLAVFSAVTLTREVQAKVESMGRLRYIVALNIEHHLSISSWAKAFPDADVIGMEGLPEKREKNEGTKGVRFKHVFTVQNKKRMSISAEFDAEFEYEYIDSHQNKELVFMHKSTGTLMAADLIFNLPAIEQYSKSEENPNSGLLTKLSGNLLHTRGDVLWQKRILWYVSCSNNREGFAESAKRIHEWDFERIIPCHGDVIETGGKNIFARTTVWFREGKQ